MLERLRIKNFRSLVDVDVPLKPLTVLIGNNDTGKTTFLRAVNTAVLQSKFEAGDHHRGIIKNEILIKAVLANGGDLRRGTPDLYGLDPSVVPTTPYQLPAGGPLMTSKGYDDLAGAQQIEINGAGIPSLLDYILRRDRSRFSKLVEELKNHVPGLTDIGIATPASDERRLDLVLEDGFRMPAGQASAGVRLLLFFIALTYHPTPPKIILLEEPETGLHPKRLAQVIELLRAITRGEHGGHAAQVILTTHSPYLLDSIDLETDQVLVFRRNEDGTRSAEPVDDERLKVFLDEFQLGEVWFNQGEEGLVARK